MEIFRKGSNPPPPLFLEVMERVRHNSILVTKRAKTKLPKNTKNGYIYYNPFRKSAQKYPKPFIFIKNSTTFEEQKCASKLWIGPNPPSIIWKNSITNPFFFMASLIGSKQWIRPNR